MGGRYRSSTSSCGRIDGNFHGKEFRGDFEKKKEEKLFEERFEDYLAGEGSSSIERIGNLTLLE